jgi:AraC-like DNA-binding protein
MFPEFNIYSTTLLVLSIQGLIFSLLLFVRYRKKKNPADLLLGLILLITCYHQTSYTIGFMGWYDTYRNTKINYYLVNLSLLLAPLLYFYIRSATASSFDWRRIKFWHFLPIVVYVLLKLFILVYDARQPGFDDDQNGYLVRNFEWKYLNPILFLLCTFQMLLYLAFSFQVLFEFRRKVRQYFANTYQLELNWLLHFLMAYSFLYVFYNFQIVIDEVIIDLHWTQEWWYYLLSGIAIIYVGVKGYFTPATALQSVDFESFQPPVASLASKTGQAQPDDQMQEQKQRVLRFFEQEKPYLNSELTLGSLAEQLDLSREELSALINQGFNSRFNDYINGYRIEAIKEMIEQGQHQSLSILGMAYEAGFNSKATFNRAFKKSEGQSPSEYLKSIS